MESDTAAVDERKEGGIALLLRAGEHADGDPSDFSQQPPYGQLQISWRYPALSRLEPALIDTSVYFACCCVGAPLVVGGSPRMDASGLNQLCEKCGQRLSRVKHHRAHGLGRACHPQCKPSKRAVDNAVVDPSRDVRSHKRGRSESGKQPSTPAVLIAPPPLPTPPQPSFSTHGASLRPSSRSSRATAASWFELARDGELAAWERKRGGFYQHDTANSLKCSFLDEKRIRLRHSVERIARAELSTLGVDATSLRLAAIKLLRASPGEGEQEIHYDITEYARAVRCFTVLLYLTDTESTAVPRLSLQEIRPCFTNGEQHPSAAALAVLSRDKFQSERVAAGDMLAFNCAVPHFGVKNPDAHDRFVLFLLFYPSTSPMPDTEEQRYPHGVED